MKSCPQCGNSYNDDFTVCPGDKTALIHIASSGADPMLGRLLAGRFLLVGKLGQGGMGSVYKALHTQMDRVCAIKVLSPMVTDIEVGIARFKREAKMASRIDNPHAVTIYDFGSDEGGLLYLAMECIDGKSLSQILKQQHPLEISRIAHITEQIASALAAAHRLGIVHRDLKPDNIMLTKKAGESDYVKVLDFGIAKTMADDMGDHVTQTGAVLGTPLYMSPEQLSGEKLDGRSDTYGLATMVYEMLSGRLPFDGENTQAIMIKRITNDPIQLGLVAPSVSDSIARAVMDGLARNRDDRPQTVEGFAHALREAVKISTHPIGPRAADERGERGSSRETAPSYNDKTVTDGSLGWTGDNANLSTDFTRVDGAITPTTPFNREEHSAPERIEYPPAATYITKPSVEPVKIQPDQTQPSEPGWEATKDLHSAQSAPTVKSNVPPPPYPSPYPSAPVSVQAAPQKSRSAALIITAVVVVAFIIVVTVGYLIFPRLSGQSPPPTVHPPTINTPPETGRTVGPSEHYENAKKHQEQAYLLASSGSKSEATEENQKAILEYRMAISGRPVYPEAHENLGVALYNTSQTEAALSEYQIAMKQYTEQSGRPTAQVLTNYGLALYDLKRYREAADSFGQALEIDPNDYDLYAHRGFALQNAGNQSGARSAYQQYLRLSPTGQYADFIREIIAGRAQPPTDSGNQ